MTKSVHALDLSRRNILKGAAMLAGGSALLGVGLAAGSAGAGTKMTQKATGYQDTPRGKAQCDNCAQWQPPGACKLVEGVISPTGWCRVYAPKS